MKRTRTIQPLLLMMYLLIGAFAHGANISVSVVPENSTIASPQSCLWKVLVSNPSDEIATNTKLRIKLPQDGIYEVDASSFSVRPSTRAPYGFYMSGQTVLYNIGLMPPGHSMHISISTYTPKGITTGTRIEMSAQAECDQGFAKSSAACTVNERASRIQLSAPSLHAESEKSYEFTANYSYSGNLPLEGAKLVVTMPDEFAASSGSEGSTTTSSKISWNFDTLSKGDNGYKSFTLSSSSTAKPGTILMIKGEIVHQGTVIDRAFWPMVVSSRSGLECRAYSSQRQVNPDNSILWNIEVMNQSESPSLATTLTVHLPGDQLTIHPKYFNPLPSTTTMDYYFSTRCVHYNLGTLNPGARKVFRIRTWPGASATEGQHFLLFASTRSDGEIRGASSQWAVSLGSHSSMTSDIQVEYPEFSVFKDNQSKPANFGSRSVSRSSTKRFYVRNLGTADLLVSNVVIVGENAGDWLLGEMESTEVMSSASASLPITFKPKAKGLRKATIRIYSNDPNESPYDIKLVGTGL